MSPLSRRTSHVSFKSLLTLSALFFALVGAASAQEGASSAAASRARYLSETGVLPASREVAVEEFVNYHRHQIGRPRAGESVALDVRWGNDRASQSGEAVLQVGFSTALANDRQQLRPLNLALVIDKSGSMADADKMSRVKAALLTLVSQLRERDVLSIVVFDSEAQVLLPARTLGDKEAVRRLIRSLKPGSATNLDADWVLAEDGTSVEATKNASSTGKNIFVFLITTSPDSLGRRGAHTRSTLSLRKLRILCVSAVNLI